MSLEVNRDSEALEEVETQQSVDARTDRAEPLEIQRACGDAGRASTSNPERVDSNQPQRARPSDSGTDTNGADPLRQSEFLRQFLVDARKSCTGIEDQIDRAITVDVDRDSNRGTASAGKSERNLARGAVCGYCDSRGSANALTSRNGE